MKTTADNSFGAWLRKRRKALDQTQGELAGQAGCAVITIQKIEANQRRPSKPMAKRLAECLKIAEVDYPAFLEFARLGRQSHRFSVIGAGDDTTVWRWSPHQLTNLPVPPTAIIGRDHDIALARRLMLDEGARLLTLVGPPGVGKTRLAIEIAASMLDEFEDGVFFVSLASLLDSEQVVQAIAQTLAVNQLGERTFAERLKEYLRDEQALLVLDNFEQVLSAASFIGTLLAECPWVSILVTSRAPLAIRAERQFLVHPLALPDEGSAESDPQSLMRYSAIELMALRAGDRQPDFTLTSENANTIVAICRRLDGLPLAIELVAARIGYLEPQMLLEQFSARNILWVDGWRDLPDRQRTLYHAIDWSYTLLTVDDRVLLSRLSVFYGGCTEEAAQNVMLEHPAQVTLDGLRSLANHHLVVQYLHLGNLRYTLLETIRAFATQRLAESGEQDQIRQACADYYLWLAEQAEPFLRTATQLTWLDRLEAERPNLLAALEWFLEVEEDVEKGLRLAGALGWFWNVRCHVSEGRQWLAKALDVGANVRPELRITALIGAATLAFQQGDLAVARAMLEECVILCRAAGSSQRRNLSLSLGGLANVVMYQIDHQAVRLAAEESLAISKQIGDPWVTGMALLLIAEAHLLERDYHGAKSDFEAGLTILRDTGDRWGISSALMDLGYTHLLLGDLDTASTLLENSVALLREVGERSVRSLTLNILAQVRLQQGDYAQASLLYSECLDLLHKMGIEASIADVQFNLARFVQAHGNYSLAERLYNASLKMYAEQGDEQGIARCRAGLAEISGDSSLRTANS